MGKLKFSIFTIPKSFATSEVSNIQRNALGSWRNLNPKPEVILCGNDSGVATIAEERGLKHLPNIQRNKFGTPLVSDAFQRVAERAKHELVVYVNADIILLQDFVLSLATVNAKFPHNQFMMIGGRWDIEPMGRLSFTCDLWRAQVKVQIATTGVRHARGGSDYFAGRRGLLSRGMPPFAVGRCGWDNWAISCGMARGWAVVDASETATVIHQGIPGTVHHKRTEEDEFYVKMYETNKSKAIGNLSDALWVTTENGVELRR